MTYAKTLFPNNSDVRKALGIVWDGLCDVSVCLTLGILLKARFAYLYLNEAFLVRCKVLRPLRINFPHYNLCRNSVPESMFGQSRLG